jgi:hypothetical protein
MYIMKLKTVSAALLAALSFAAGHAGAVTFEGPTAHAANHVVDYSSASLVSFDIDLSHFSPVTLSFRIEAADLISSQVGLNGLVRNLSGLGLTQARVTLGGVSFAAPAGTLTTDGFVTPTVQSGAGFVQASFGPALTTEYYIGNPLSVASGATDWTLDLSGHQVGDTFSVTVAVPESETCALAVAGLLIAGQLARRRTRRPA